MTDDSGMPPEIETHQQEEYEDQAQEIQADLALYMEMQNQLEMERSNVVPISRVAAEQMAAKHTADELIPETLADVIFSKLCFSPEESLQAAAHESWILDDLIPAHGIGFIYGAPGSYKSFMALDMAACVSSGRAWHGYECETPGAVVYIAAEGSRGLMERTVAWKRHHECDIGPFAVLTMPVMMDDLLMVQAFTECLERAAEILGQPIRMVVVDTMARSFSGDENSAQEVGAFVNACSRFSQAVGDCFVLVVAHTGKDQSRGMRGSSALDGAADCHFLVKKVNEGQALMTNTKQKDVEMAEPMRFAMETVSTGITDRKGRIRRSLVPILESKGADADPDNQDEITAFDHKDMNVLRGMVKAAESAGKKITEDDLRKEFIGYLMGECNKKDEAARKGWQRTYKRAREQGALMKAGAFIYLGDK